ncbi:MAG: enoyl-CoA hydratase [Pseudomonadota bacterium]
MDDILIEARVGAVATLTMNRPAAMNALSRALRARLAERIGALGRDGETRAIVLTGAGTRAFTAGLDLKELGADRDALSAPATAETDPAMALAACPIPAIAAVNGAAITGGFELALACDLLIAGASARFADTHARVGVMPGWGLSQRLSRIVGPARAKDMSLTGRFIDAETAAAWGLVSRVVPDDRLAAEAAEAAAAIAAADPAVVAGLKRTIDDGYALPFADAMKLEAERAADWNGATDPAAIEGRRRSVVDAGRAAR